MKKTKVLKKEGMNDKREKANIRVKELNWMNKERMNKEKATRKNYIITLKIIGKIENTRRPLYKRIEASHKVSCEYSNKVLKSL